jgi:hypothetical protein
MELRLRFREIIIRAQSSVMRIGLLVLEIRSIKKDDIDEDFGSIVAFGDTL